MFNKSLTASALALTALVSATPVMATQAGDFLARARIINVSPDVSSGEILLAGTSTPWPSAGSGIDVDSKATLDIDFTYFVTDNFGLELLLDITSKHDIQGTGSAAVGKVGEVTVLPPALIAQYHFTPGSNIRPYAGLGLNYTFFLSEETTSTLTNALPGASTSGLDIDDTFALVAQAGVDIDIDKELFFNFDVKYIALDTTATISANGATAATVDFDLNPLVIGAGVGIRF